MSEEPDESIQLEQVKEVAPKPKRVYKKSTKSVDNPPPSLAGNANGIAPLDVPPVSNDSPKGMTQHVSVKEPSPVASTTTPVIKEKKARTQKQIDAFNKMREAYLNKHKTPVIEPAKEPEPTKEPEPIKEEPYELGTKKVQKPRAKKNKQVELNQEVNESPPVTQIVHANQVINNSPTPPPVAIPKVSTAPRFVFV